MQILRKKNLEKVKDVKFRRKRGVIAFMTRKTLEMCLLHICIVKGIEMNR